MKKIILEIVKKTILETIKIIVLNLKNVKIVLDLAKITVIRESNKILKKGIVNIPFFDGDDFHNLFGSSH